tara:strand:- start:250 stop:816 length:567 start_codon:yes stop_codon:yes gene_type:complete
MLSRDTYLALLSHATLGIGLFALSYFPGASTLIARTLLGDILATEAADLIKLGFLSTSVIFFTGLFWRPLLSITLHEDLAAVEGIRIGILNFFFMVLLSLTIALSTQYLGVLLVTALLILPASSSRYLSNTPFQMVIIAFLIGVLGLILGFWTSSYFDTATAPSLVASHVLIFIIVLLVHPLKQHFLP